MKDILQSNVLWDFSSLLRRSFEMTLCCLIREKVHNIPESTGGAFVQFRVSAVGTRDHRKFFVLHIEYFRQRSAGGSDFVHLILFVAAFWTNVFLFFHDLQAFCKVGKSNK